MLKSKYVHACLIWLLQCLLSTVHTVNTNIFFTKSCSAKPKNDNTIRSIHTRHNTTAIPTKHSSSKVQTSTRGAKANQTVENHQIEYDTLSKEAKNSSRTSNTSSAIPENTEIADSVSDKGILDTALKVQEGPIQSIVQYAAKEDIVFDINRHTIYLHGASSIEYDTIKLEAEEILLDWKNHTIAAFSKKSTTGDIEKKAVLNKDGAQYIAESVHYHFESQRAIANKLFTKQEDGILRANKVKKDREATFYTDQATYTTCNLTKPHFHVAVRRLKITQNDKVVSGPFRLYFDDVPTPLGFPFGIFYLPRQSGIIPPKYDIDGKKGFGLQNGGYYIKFNDYIDLALQGSLYSKGSTDFTAESNYKKRYRYSGNLRFDRSIYLDPDESELSRKYKSWRFQWKHSTDYKQPSSWYAQIDLERKNFQTTRNALTMEESSETEKDSSIRYTNMLVRLPLPYTLNSSLRLHTSQLKEAYASLPEISLGTTNMYPFRKKDTANSTWYSNIFIRHKLEFQRKLSNSFDDTLNFLKPRDWPVLWANGTQGIRHTMPLQTDVKILNYLSLTPKITYQERWYWEKKEYKYNSEGDIKEDIVPGFVRVYDYSLAAKLQTVCYGTYFFSRNAKVQAIRHRIRPELSFTYRPDFSSPEYGYWQTVEGGKHNGKKLNKFEKAVYSAPDVNKTASLAISLNNRLDMKVKDSQKDPKSTNKIPVLESFDWSTSYNFLADQHAWSDIQFKTRTNLFNKLVRVSFESTFDPYLYVSRNSSNQRGEREYIKSNALAWSHGKGLGHVKHASLSISATLGAIRKSMTLSKKSKLEDDVENIFKEGKHPQGNSEHYVDFTIPWDLELDYNWQYTCEKPGNTPQKINSLRFNWHIHLTSKWEITCQSTYDLTENEFVGNSTNIGIHRDLHCWEMDFNWNPLGDQQTYKFSIGLKAPLLKDIKYSRGERKYTKY